MKTFKKIARVAIPLAMAVLPVLTFATLTGPVNPITSNNPVTMAEIQTRIQQIANFLIVVSIIIAVVFIIWGAIVYMSAGGNEDRTKKGRSYIFGGIIGAAVIFAIGIILQTTAGLVTRTFFGN